MSPEAKRAYQREWIAAKRAASPELRAEEASRKARWNAEHRDRTRAASRRHYGLAENRDRHNGRVAAFRAEHRQAPAPRPEPVVRICRDCFAPAADGNPLCVWCIRIARSLRYDPFDPRPEGEGFVPEPASEPERYAELRRRVTFDPEEVL